MFRTTIKKNALERGSFTANDVCFISILKCRPPIIKAFSFVHCPPGRKKHADTMLSCSDSCLVTVTLYVQTHDRKRNISRLQVK
jgi:hypothetical protein